MQTMTEYAKLDEDYLRRQLMFIMTFIESKKLFLHGDELEIVVGRKKRKFPLILILTILNTLVPRGTMLLYGGHGGGKTTLVKILGTMMTRMNLSEIERTILRGHPHLTEEKIIARLDIGKLIRDGEEVVEWRPFVDSFWKIIDEVNRIPPQIQDILFSLLAEGVVKYAGEAREVGDYILYATLNPHDVGTFEMGLPFLDRFSIAVPVTMPKIGELKEILFRREERIHQFERVEIPKVMDEEIIRMIWHMIDEVKVPEETAFFITYLVSSMRACIRIRKEVSEKVKVGPILCEGCHFNTEKSVCNKVVKPPSVRVIQDLRRYSKALTWLLGLEEVQISIVKSLAPYIIWHRIEFVEEFVEDKPFFGDRLEFAKRLVDLIYQRFVLNYSKYLSWIEKAKSGSLTESEKKDINLAAKSDVVVETDLKLVIKEFQDATYRRYRGKIKAVIKEIEGSRKTISLEELINKVYDLINELETNDKLKLHARNELIGDLYDILFKLTNFEVRFRLDEWRKKHQLIEAKIIKEKKNYENTEIESVLNSLHIFLQKVNRSLFEFKRKALFMVFNSLPELKMDVIVSKLHEDDEEPTILFRFRGGKTALILKSILQL